MTDERRRDDRVEVDFFCNKYVKGRPYLCQASNLSEEGLMVHSYQEPENNDPLIGLQFCLPESDQVITASGRVVHRPDEGGYAGVRFTSIAWEHRQMILEYLARCKDEPSAMAS